jgi:hypothetical protein
MITTIPEAEATPEGQAHPGANPEIPAVAAAPEGQPPDAQSDGARPEGGEGLAHLRAKLEEAHRDISDKYKPSHELAERYGGVDELRRATALYDALVSEADPAEAAQKLLDQAYDLGGEQRYFAVAAELARSHPQELLLLIRRDHPELFSAAPPAPPADLAEDDFDDPEQGKAFRAIREQNAALARELEELRVAVGRTQEQAGAQAAQAQAGEFESGRMSVIEAALSAANVPAEVAQDLRTLIVNDFNRSDYAKEYNAALRMITQGEAELTRGRARWIDSNLAALAAARISAWQSQQASPQPTPAQAAGRPPGTAPRETVPGGPGRQAISLSDRQALLARLNARQGASEV